MIPFILVFWPGLAGAAVLGLVVGGLVGWPSRVGPPLALGLAAMLLASGAFSGLVTGAAGLWLEAAALILPPYLAGCALGGLARWLVLRR